MDKMARTHPCHFALLSDIDILVSLFVVGQIQTVCLVPLGQSLVGSTHQCGVEPSLVAFTLVYHDCIVGSLGLLRLAVLGGHGGLDNLGHLGYVTGLCALQPAVNTFDGLIVLECVQNVVLKCVVAVDGHFLVQIVERLDQSVQILGLLLLQSGQEGLCICLGGEQRVTELLGLGGVAVAFLIKQVNGNGVGLYLDLLGSSAAGIGGAFCGRAGSQNGLFLFGVQLDVGGVTQLCSLLSLFVLLGILTGRVAEDPLAQIGSKTGFVKLRSIRFCK